MPGRKKPVKIIFFIDFENLIINAPVSGMLPERYSLEKGFEKIIEIITEEIGEIVRVVVFMPDNRVYFWGQEIYKLGFDIVLCPKITAKDRPDRDTVDERLMNFGEWLMNYPGITHRCVGSGDKHFVPFLQKARLKGLKRIIVAGDVVSLSSETLKLASKKPDSPKKMVYLFSPVSPENKI